MRTFTFFNDLSFTSVRHQGQDIALLADEQGKVIPGQTAIHIAEPDKHNIRKVTVIFEVMADIPEGCLTTCNWKEGE